MRPRWPRPLSAVPGFPAELVAPLAAHGLATVGDLVARVKAQNPGLLPPAFALGLNVWLSAYPVTDRAPAHAAGAALAAYLGLGEYARPADWTDTQPEPPACMNAFTYNVRVADLKRRKRWWSDPAVPAAAAALCGATRESGCNEHGVFTNPAREVLARAGKTAASALLITTPVGLWFATGVFEGVGGSSSGLPSVTCTAHDTREAARLDAMREALRSAAGHASSCAFAEGKRQAARVADQLRTLLAQATKQQAPMPNTKPRTLPTASLSLHPQVNLVPAMRPDQYAEFKKDVADRGVQKPIELIPGTRTIVDGRTRWMAATDAGLPSVPVVDAVFAEGESPVAYMIRVAYLRRQLTTGQRAALAVELKKELARAARERRKDGALKGAAASAEARRPGASLPAIVPEGSPAGKSRGGEAREQAAAAVGVSGRTVTTAEAVEKKAPELFARVKDGTMPLAEAARIVAGGKKAKPAPDPTDPDWKARGTGGPVALLPCPFCGAADLKVLIGTWRLVQCQVCFATGPRKSIDNDIQAKEAWNRRAAK